MLMTRTFRFRPCLNSTYVDLRVNAVSIIMEARTAVAPRLHPTSLPQRLIINEFALSYKSEWLACAGTRSMCPHLGEAFMIYRSSASLLAISVAIIGAPAGAQTGSTAGDETSGVQ